MTVKYRKKNDLDADKWYSFDFKKSAHNSIIITELLFDAGDNFNEFFDKSLALGYVFYLPALTKITIKNSDLGSFRFDPKYRDLFPSSVKVEFERCTNYSAVEDAFNQKKPSRSLNSIFIKSAESSGDESAPLSISVQNPRALAVSATERVGVGERLNKQTPLSPSRSGVKHHNVPAPQAAAAVSGSVGHLPTVSRVPGSGTKEGAAPAAGFFRDRTLQSLSSFSSQTLLNESSSASDSSSDSDSESSSLATPLPRSGAGNPLQDNTAMMKYRKMAKGVQVGGAQKTTHTKVGEHPLEVSSPIQEERPPQKIRDAIADTIKTNAPGSERRYSTEIAYMLLDTDRETGVKLYYTDPKQSDKFCVLVATSDTVYVSPKWKNMDKKTSLDQKALVVLGSLGIPPCPEQIDISNEDSGLGKRVRAVFEELKASQEETLVVSIVSRS